jgi:hypothetical protein
MPPLMHFFKRCKNSPRSANINKYNRWRQVGLPIAGWHLFCTIDIPIDGDCLGPDQPKAKPRANKNIGDMTPCLKTDKCVH